MAPSTVLPMHGDVLVDACGEGRVMRLSWYSEGELMVLSLWRGESCSGTFRMTRAQVVELINCMTTGLATQHPDTATRPHAC